jgi:hypothetical protein
MALVTVELDRQELLALGQLVRAKAAELDRVQAGMEEAEGMDLQRHNALKALQPQAELLETLLLKLDGAARELEGKR